MYNVHTQRATVKHATSIVRNPVRKTPSVDKACIHNVLQQSIRHQLPVKGLRALLRGRAPVKLVYDVTMNHSDSVNPVKPSRAVVFLSQRAEFVLEEFEGPRVQLFT